MNAKNLILNLNSSNNNCDITTSIVTSHNNSDSKNCKNLSRIII